MLEQPKIKFKTGEYGKYITPVPCEKENDTSVWIMEDSYKGGTHLKRYAKRSSWHCFFDTPEEAKAYLKAQFQEQINSLQGCLLSAYEKMKELIDILPDVNAGDSWVK